MSPAKRTHGPGLISGERTLDEVQRRLVSLVRSYESWQRHRIASHGVTVAQGFAVVALDEDHPMRMRELSEELGLALSTVTRMVDRLVAQDLVVRYAGHEDRREVLVELTDRGAELKRHFAESQRDAMKIVGNAIPLDEREAALSILRRLDDALGVATRDWPSSGA